MANKRYPVSGVVTGPIPSGTGTVGAVGPCINLLGVGITAGRTLWLRKAWFFNSIASQPFAAIADAATTATGPTGVPYLATESVRAVVHLASGVSGSGGILQNAYEIVFDPPGLKFTTGCVVASSLTTSGITNAGGLGYEE